MDGENRIFVRTKLSADYKETGIDIKKINTESDRLYSL